MQICIVSHHCIPHVGGIESLAHIQARGLSKRGHAIVHVSAKSLSNQESGYRDNYLLETVWATDILERRFGIPYPMFSPKLVSVLSKHLASADVCVIHSIGFFSSFVAAHVCRKFNVPYIVLQNNTFVDFPNPITRKLQKINDGWLSSFVARHATRIAVVDRKTYAYIRTLSKRESVMLYNAADPSQFFPADSRSTIRNLLGLPLDKKLVLTTGRLVHKRGIDLLLETASAMKDNCDLHFLVVGDGVKRDEYRKYIQTESLANCTLLGEVPHAEIANYYRASDIFVLTSRTGEGFPIAVIEAWLSGLPVIATNTGGHRDFLGHGQNGLLVEPDSIESICASILFLLGDGQQMAKHISVAGQALALKKFTAEVHVSHLEALLHSVLKKHLESSSGVR